MRNAVGRGTDRLRALPLSGPETDAKRLAPRLHLTVPEVTGRLLTGDYRRSTAAIVSTSRNAFATPAGDVTRIT